MKRKIVFIACAAATAIAVAVCVYTLNQRQQSADRAQEQTSELHAIMDEAEEEAETEQETAPAATATPTPTTEPTATPTPEPVVYEMLAGSAALYEQNPDFIGWLSVPGTSIDYPVVQTPAYEEEYLYLDFNRNEDINGTLIMDNDSEVGIGTKEQDYVDGKKPSTNLIIHGHDMKSGAMFGNLHLFTDAAYGAEHHTIAFQSLYETRTYELISVFYSQVYYPTDDVFKYYEFFEAETQEQFDDWYNNIKALQLYDTGVTAEFGDEFITLSTCSFHTEDGRLVVVGKRVS